MRFIVQNLSFEKKKEVYDVPEIKREAKCM